MSRRAAMGAAHGLDLMLRSCAAAIAALLLAAAPLAAAERRMDAPPPGVRAVCDPGFQAIEGTRTCVRIGGRVRTEAAFGKGRRGPPIGSEGRVRIEARTPTDYGPARAVIEMRAGNLPRGGGPAYAQ